MENTSKFTLGIWSTSDGSIRYMARVVLRQAQHPFREVFSECRTGLDQGGALSALREAYPEEVKFALGEK